MQPKRPEKIDLKKNKFEGGRGGQEKCKRVSERATEIEGSKRRVRVRAFVCVCACTLRVFVCVRARTDILVGVLCEISVRSIHSNFADHLAYIPCVSCRALSQ
jgi:hypothetical protein